MSNQMTLLEIYKTYLNDIREEKSNQMKITNYILIFYSVIYFITMSNIIQYNLNKNIGYIFVVIMAIFGVYYLCKSQMQIFKSKKMIEQLKKERWELTQFLDKEATKPSEGIFKLSFMILLTIIGPVILSKIILNFDNIVFFFTSTLLVLSICMLATYFLALFVKLMKNIRLA